MNDCSNSIKLIYPYLDGELDTKGSALVQAHIRECVQCRETFADEQEFLELVRVCARSSHNFEQRFLGGELVRRKSSTYIPHTEGGIQ